LPSLTRIDTVAVGSLPVAARFRATVAVDEPPPVTLVGFNVTDSIASGGGVRVTFTLRGAPAPLAVTVVAMLEVAALVAVSIPRCCSRCRPRRL